MSGNFSVNAEGLLDFIEKYSNGIAGYLGLDGAKAIEIASNGKHIYATGYNSNTIVTLTRNTSDGTLTYTEHKTDNIGGVDGMDGPIALSLSPDGKNIYVLGKNENAIAVFSRNISDGLLTFYEMKQNGSDGVTNMTSPTAIDITTKSAYVVSEDDKSIVSFTRTLSNGSLTYQNNIVRTTDLDGASSVYISPDGKNVYATGKTNGTVIAFTRSTSNGAISYFETQTDDAGGITKLGGAHDIIMSGDNKHLYVASYDDDAVVVFSRNTSTGALTFVQEICSTDAGIEGLDGASALEISGDNKTVYVASANDNTVSVFKRNNSTGELTFIGHEKDGMDGVSGLSGPTDVVVSPNNAHIYVTGFSSSSVVLFNRN